MKRRGWSWKDVQLPERLTDRLGTDFERAFYEAALRTDPVNLEVLIALGDIYSKQGLLEQGLRIDERLVELEPREPKFHYNLACAHSLLGHVEAALKALARAFQLGYSRIEHLRDDPDLDNLKKDRRFHEILRQHLARQAQGKKKVEG
ncbi:MAG: hypothetical protein HY721_33930 [Planctomycetes bacterium]|nr:hypothetical protein [Planctomycetota bacterium]